MQTVLSEGDRNRLITLSRIAVTNFNAGDWKMLGILTGHISLVVDHDRLLRSLSFSDPDYSGNAHEVMFSLGVADPKNLGIIDQYVVFKYGDDSENISSGVGGGRSISFTPSVFEVPDGGVEKDLIAVMMPFAPEFEPVFGAIDRAGRLVGYKSLRAKDIWEHSTVIQDVFSLIFRSHIVVCDFTGKNPNVFYEAGIAHTLGKHVVPITQSSSDVPFDLRHHRYLSYLNNNEGRTSLSSALSERFRAL